MTYGRSGTALGSLPIAVYANQNVASRARFVSTRGAPTIRPYQDRLPVDMANEYGVSATVHIKSFVPVMGRLDQQVATCIRAAIQAAVPVPTEQLNNMAADPLARLFEFDIISPQSLDTVFVFLRDHNASNIFRQCQVVELEVPGAFTLRMTFGEDQNVKLAMRYGILLPPFPSSTWATPSNLNMLVNGVLNKRASLAEKVRNGMQSMASQLPPDQPCFLQGQEHQPVHSCTKESVLDVLSTTKGTPLRLLTPELIATMYRRQAYRLVFKAADRGTFVLMLMALSNQNTPVEAGRTPFKNFQPFQHAGTAWYQNSTFPAESKLLVALELDADPNLRLDTRLAELSNLATRNRASQMAVAKAIMRPGKPITLSAPAVVPMLDALADVDWESIAKDCPISPDEPLTREERKNKKRKEMGEAKLQANPTFDLRIDEEPKEKPAGRPDDNMQEAEAAHPDA
ncbi:hypothetical protein ABBQ38_011210 [Trebouxia sp. C0009 RCD-2024]